MSNIVEFECIPDRCLYSSDEYKVYGTKVDLSLFPHVQLNKHNNVTISGNFHTLATTVKYSVKAEETNTKHGVGYKVLNIRRDKPQTLESSRVFLSEILTYTQVNSILNAYPDIIDKVIKNDLDDIDLNKTPYIKEATFDNIKKKIVENFCLIELIDKFNGLLEMSVLRKLHEKYPSVQKIISELKRDPYKCLCGLARISFKSGDKILLQLDKASKKLIEEGNEPIIDFGFDLKTSKQREKACIMFCLDEEQKNGNTNMDIKELRLKCKTLAPACIEHFVDVIKNDEHIYFDIKSKVVALKSTYNIELFIADKIKEGLNSSVKWNFELDKYKESGLTDEQLSVLETLCVSNVMILNGYGGCVDCDTEYFNGFEWKRIVDYKKGDLVLQYNKDGSANLVNPIEYHKYPQEYLWHFSTKYGLDQCLSDEHNVYYITSKNNLYHKSFKEVRENHERSGFLGSFITTFSYQNNLGIEYDEWMIRLMVAIKADGSFQTDKQPNKCHINIKKQRKKERIEWLLNQNKIIFTTSDKENGFTTYSFYISDNEKTYTAKWYNCTKNQFKIIYDEIFYWDGDFAEKNRYFTTIKSDADFIQFVGTSIGYRATIDTADRRGRIRELNGKEYITKSIDYIVNFTDRILVGMCCDKRSHCTKTPINQYKTIDGYKYCFTVDSGMLVLRRNDKIFITGNSGKTYTTQTVLEMLNDNHKSYKLFSPTGRAAKVLSGYCKYPASTIHRGLEFRPPNNWGYNKDCTLWCDVLIIDEFSMVDIFIMQKLLDAIDFSRTKLLIIGDNCQIMSVGAGNILHDMMHSSCIPTVTLTKIFRYGVGGLMTVATNTREGKKFLTDTGKVEIFGEDKGYIFIPTTQETIVNKLVQLYKKLLSDGLKPDDIWVLTAYNKGQYGSVVINSKLQVLANSKSMFTKGMTIGDTTFYKDDLVLNTSNNYKAKLYKDKDANSDICDDEKEVFIPNGEIGRIINITDASMIINFDGLIVIYDKSEVVKLKLAYGISCHKSQGGQTKVVIILTPKAHSQMLNSNLIYVGQTRAQLKCYHLGDVTTVNRSIKEKVNFNRNTFLLELLQNNNQSHI